VEGDGEVVRIRKSIYGNFIFAPAFLLISSIIGMTYRNNPEQGFNYGAITLIGLFFTIVLFLIFR
jgi:hypothetical protein